MIITTLGTNIRQEILPGVSIKSTLCFVLKIRFCKADSPKTFLCNSIASKQNFVKATARVCLGTLFSVGLISPTDKKTRWTTCPSSNLPHVLFSQLRFWEYLLPLNLRLHYFLALKSSSAAILCGQLPPDLVP